MRACVIQRCARRNMFLQRDTAIALRQPPWILLRYYRFRSLIHQKRDRHPFVNRLLFNGRSPLNYTLTPTF